MQIHGNLPEFKGKVTINVSKLSNGRQSAQRYDELLEHSYDADESKQSLSRYHSQHVNPVANFAEITQERGQDNKTDEERDSSVKQPRQDSSAVAIS